MVEMTARAKIRDVVRLRIQGADEISLPTITDSVVTLLMQDDDFVSEFMKTTLRSEVYQQVAAVVAATRDLSVVGDTAMTDGAMKRKASEFARCYHSKARVAFVASLPCACGCSRSPCENAHTLTGGVGRKGHYLTIIPLFPECHRKQHEGGWEAIGMTRAAAQLYGGYVEFRWQAHRAREGDDA